MSPALAGGFLTTVPPGKSRVWFLLAVVKSLFQEPREPLEGVKEGETFRKSPLLAGMLSDIRIEEGLGVWAWQKK